MSKLSWTDWTAIALIAILTSFYAWTMMDVPFHPDESTHIFMSKDLSTYIQNPLDLAWDGGLPLGDEERIRAIDAPLAKYLIGAVRGIFSVPALGSDWDWSLDWEENHAQGALPNRSQLLAARAALTVLLPFCLWLFYRMLIQYQSGITSLAGTLLFGLHPLVLLHGRRGMSEALLLLGICLFLCVVSREKRNPWLIGLTLGLAIGAKHSAIGLLPAGILAAAMVPDQNHDLTKSSLNLFKLFLGLSIIILLLNPFYWKDPINALRAGLDARFSLAREQQEDHLGPGGMGLETTVPGLVLNLYHTEPQTEEVGNYLDQTRESKEAYLAHPLHSWGRDLISSAVMFSLSLVGLGLTLRNYTKKTSSEKEQVLILGLATLGMGAFSALLLPWQRYAVAVLPFVIYWIAVGLEPILLGLSRIWTRD